MERRGDLFNQLAIISNLLEKINLQTESQTIILELPEQEFYRVYKMVESRVKYTQGVVGNSFNVKIGVINIIFNMSNV